MNSYRTDSVNHFSIDTDGECHEAAVLLDDGLDLVCIEEFKTAVLQLHGELAAAGEVCIHHGGYRGALNAEHTGAIRAPCVRLARADWMFRFMLIY